MPATSQIVDGSASYGFIAMRGMPQLGGQNIEEISRPGVDGAAYRLNGMRAEPFEVVGVVDVNDVSAAAVLMSNLHSLQGRIVSYYDGFGDYFEVMVLRVSRLAQRRLIAAAGGRSVARQLYLAVSFQFQFVVR